LDSEISLEKDKIYTALYAFSLSKAHISKALHNLRFSQEISADYIDWKIIELYYAVYHSALALISTKGYITKSHTATFLMLIKLFDISSEDTQTIDELRITKEDAEFYTQLKEERTKANYSTNLVYDMDRYSELRNRAIIFVNKANAIIYTIQE
jgi:uncharacterized protein (UPF0332 family)